jgi:hypothetical protein
VDLDNHYGFYRKEEKRSVPIGVGFKLIKLPLENIKGIDYRILFYSGESNSIATKSYSIYSDLEVEENDLHDYRKER